MAQIHDPKGLLNLRFECPRCGGHMFGTSSPKGKHKKGHCHDYKPNGERCGFTWLRPEEDWKVFKPKP